MTSAHPLASAVNSIPKASFYEIYLKHFLDFHIFSFFLAFNQDFIIYIDLTRIAASNTANDYASN